MLFESVAQGRDRGETKMRISAKARAKAEYAAMMADPVARARFEAARAAKFLRETAGGPPPAERGHAHGRGMDAPDDHPWAHDVE